MSEDSDFISKNKPQKNPDELGCGLDLFSFLGKGMLATEAVRNAPGLTPLSPLVRFTKEGYLR